ncbi:MAG: transglutaminase-like domain-containing protein [Flavobacteriales bacterium]|nr:transglutaminase-like domain-containing protein [Flavobacteriales bacterium]
MTYSELNALCQLLDDPDSEVFTSVSDRLLSYGPQAIPVLESHWERSLDHIQQNRIEDIIHRIQFDGCRAALKAWVDHGAEDLLDGALIMARYQYPDLDEDHVRQHLARIRTDIWLDLNEGLTALETVRVMNHILFDVHGFSGNTQNYIAPQNSFINIVLESHKGNPLSLGIITVILAQQLDIPIVGINLPEHFSLGYRDIHQPDHTEMMFYINPFNRGAVFGKQEVLRFLKKMNVEPDERILRPATPLEMIYRMTNNLVLSYTRMGYTEKADEVKALQEVFPRSSPKK